MVETVTDGAHRPEVRGNAMNMNRMQRAVVLLTLLDQLKEKGSWCGETHLQKATFFLQELAQVPLELDFVLYKHGPYSFDLNDEITALRADMLLTVKPRAPYGPSLYTSDGGRTLFERYQQTLGRYATAITFVADQLGPSNVSELEKLGTALYVLKIIPSADQETRSKKLQEFKPHVRPEEAMRAVQDVDKMRTEVAGYLPVRESLPA
jgi:uncharacterized protein YwgA